MHKFQCPICLAEHPLITLLEFPQPQIIFDISSGRLSGELEYVSKNIFRINNDYVILQCEINFPIQDYEDQCDLLVWAKITHSNFQVQREAIKMQDTVVFKGQLIHTIPFLNTIEQLDVDIRISFAREETPIIQTVYQAPALAGFMEKGIPRKDLFALLGKLYHGE